MRQTREENEDEGEQPEFRQAAGNAPDRLEEILEKEEKPKPTRRTRATLGKGGNFVRLNLKRKTYSRGSLRGKFLRRQVWKQKWRKKFGAASDLCFRCGGRGHWASECPGKDLGSFPREIPEEEEEEALPTLEEAARRSDSDFIPEIPDGRSNRENSQLTPNSLDFQWPEYSPPSPPPPVDPLYSPNPDGTIPGKSRSKSVEKTWKKHGKKIHSYFLNPTDPPGEVLEALRILGYDSFRPGQAEAVMRILCGWVFLPFLS
ncbi:RECQ4 helicase, partial [Picathartes gymnocephalus]|nr:RECQ4 helicase [Picathartes gymnocephalus]